MSAWLLHVLHPFLSMAGLFLLLALGFSSANNCSLLLLSVFTLSMAILASKASSLSWAFLPLMSPAFFWSSYNCYCCAMDNAGLLHLGMSGLGNGRTFYTWFRCSFFWYYKKKVTTAMKSFLYLSEYFLMVGTALNNLSPLMPLSRYQSIKVLVPIFH